MEKEENGKFLMEKNENKCLFLNPELLITRLLATKINKDY